MVRIGVLRGQNWNSQRSKKVRTGVLTGQGWSGLEF